MKDILIGIDKLAKEELEKADKVNPLFHSDHEGYAVIKEEFEEAVDEIVAAKKCKNSAWESIKVDYPGGARTEFRKMRDCIALAAAELIQVIAMCDKFILSQSEREKKHEKDV